MIKNIKTEYKLIRSIQLKDESIAISTDSGHILIYSFPLLYVK